MISKEETANAISTINTELTDHLDQEQKEHQLNHQLNHQIDQSTADENNLNEEDENKVFTVNDIQTLMNNQLHKSQLDRQNLEKNKLEQQQHLILVTQNGDKIILIQNPSVTDNQAAAASVQLANNNTNHHHQLNNTIDTSSNDKQLIDKELDNQEELNNSSTNDDDFLIQQQTMHHQQQQQQINEDINLIKERDELKEKEDNFNRIQMQHKQRQQSLMLQLERLKEKHRHARLDNEDEEEEDLQTTATTTVEDDNFWEFNVDETNEYEKQRSNHKSLASSTKQYAKKKSIPIEKFYCEAKWWPLFCNNLEKAHNYVRRRSENIEQLSKYFPTASYAFESKCTELKKAPKKSWN